MNIRALGFASLFLLPAAGALAQPGGWHRSADGYQPSRDAYAQNYRRACRPLCAFDDTPCDPISFKLADGRCKGLFYRQ